MNRVNLGIYLYVNKKLLTHKYRAYIYREVKIAQPCLLDVREQRVNDRILIFGIDYPFNLRNIIVSLKHWLCECSQYYGGILTFTGTAPFHLHPMNTVY